VSDENLQPWLKSGAPGGVTRLLESAADDSPSPAALGKLAAKLATAGLLAPGGGGGGGGDGGGGATHAPSHAPASHVANVAHHAATAAKPLALGAKALLIGSIGVAVVGGGAFQAGRVVERHAQEQRIVLPPVAVTPPPAPPPVEEPAPPPPEPVKPTVRPAVKPVETVSPDQEAELLTAAMKDSKEGRWAGALAAAEQHARRFPHGTLAQEREMIAIEALLNLSRRPEAERRAEKFRKQWPTSTHLVRLNTLLHGQ
jgi:hypothetical protein